MTAKRISGLYAVTPDLADTQQLLAMVEATLQGGASLLQYRNKSASQHLRHQQAAALLALCRHYNVPLIINDHAGLCCELDADGVHLGGEDGNIAAARALLGTDKIIGASCYNDLDLAVEAKMQGADYVAFGACFSSGTKPAAARAPLELFSRAKHTVGLPTVAIGGIDASNLAQAISAGADSVALISAIFGGTGDICLRTATLARMFHHGRE
ncbi:MAG TPA: thiamine phosphate synthase [Methylophilaceae bacterium]|nr:thiamine phosphate synthase [Methylophilaceae bacterium]